MRGCCANAEITLLRRAAFTFSNKGSISTERRPICGNLALQERCLFKLWCEERDLNPHGISTTSPSNSRVCQFHHPRIQRSRTCQRLLEGLLAGGAGTGAAGAAALAGAVTGTGAPVNTLEVRRLVDPYARYNEVIKNAVANPPVSLVRKLPAPPEPKTVWLEPPNTAPISAPLPC